MMKQMNVKCRNCHLEVVQSEIYGDWYYCENCQKTFSVDEECKADLHCITYEQRDWIGVEKSHPSSPFEYVLVTDGQGVWLANWINDPLDWYGEEELIEIGEEWKDPHWVFELSDIGLGPFVDGKEYFIFEQFYISHWMPLPKPPSNECKADLHEEKYGYNAS